MTTQNESLEERLQREAREKYPYIHGSSTVSGHHHVTDIDSLISYTIAETLKAAVSAIEGEEKPNIPVLPARGSKPSEYHKAGQVIGFNKGLTTAITAVEEVGKNK